MRKVYRRKKRNLMHDSTSMGKNLLPILPERPEAELEFRNKALASILNRVVALRAQNGRALRRFSGPLQFEGQNATTNLQLLWTTSNEYPSGSNTSAA